MSISQYAVLAAALICASASGQDTAKQSMVGGANKACTNVQSAVLMASWAGQIEMKDHSETREVFKGTHLNCLAFADRNSPVARACILSFKSGLYYSLRPNQVIRVSEDGKATLSCGGQSPACCSVGLVVDTSPLSQRDKEALSSAAVHRGGDVPAKAISPQ